MNNNSDFLFGQYLIRFRKTPLIKENTLESALAIQKQEDEQGVKHRRLGTILMEDFYVFKNTDQLIHELEQFMEFKKEYLEKK